MQDFEFAQPRTLAQLLSLLASAPGEVELLGGGTDLVGLMKKMLVRPKRVVHIGEVDQMQGIRRDTAGDTILVGAAVHLDELLASPHIASLTALREAIEGIDSPQFQAQSTLGGELCRRPRCWYFRNGYGYLARDGQMIVEGDNRNHAILANDGPAKFVHASRLAPALIALGASAVVAGPGAADWSEVPLEHLYQVPRGAGERELALAANQVLVRIRIPRTALGSATYEVRHGAGSYDPLVAASVGLSLVGRVVRAARIVLGQVAPIPWIAEAAAQSLVGRPVTDHSARAASRSAVADAQPLSGNKYKVQLAEVAVARAILQAAGAPTGGLA
jgi:xanthine dehydrogenase YagS FAD-binding subunit